MSRLKNQMDLPSPDFNVRDYLSPDTIFSAQQSTNGNSSLDPRITWSEEPKQPSDTFPFMSLAGELRNQIYAQSLASGTVTILLVSKSIYAEAKPILYKVGVLRLGKDGMYFGRKYKDWPTHAGGISPIPSESELPLIQNVTIDIDRSLLYRTCLNDTKLFWDCWAPRGNPQPAHIREKGIMAPFMNIAGVTPRDTCQIILRNFDKAKRGKFLMSPVLHAMRYFDNFRTVILIITAYQAPEEWLDRARIHCEEELQGKLGRGIWHPEFETFDNVNHSNGYLIFHPREEGINSKRTLKTG